MMFPVNSLYGVHTFTRDRITKRFMLARNAYEITKNATEKITEN